VLKLKRALPAIKDAGLDRNAERVEEVGEHLRAFVGQQAGLNFRTMIQLRMPQKITY